MRVRNRSEPARLQVGPLLGRVLAGRLVAGPRVDDALRVAGELVSDGRLVALEHVPADADGGPGEFSELIGRVHAAGLAAHCELTLPVHRLGTTTTRRIAVAAADSGLDVVLSGPASPVAAVSADLPGAGVVVPAGEPDAETRCRQLAEGRVRLVAGRGAEADLSFVRCLNVLMAAGGHPAILATDPTLIAITGERAAWNGRAPDSWEHVMPFGVRTDEQHRLVAAGHRVRVAVPSGSGAAAWVARRLGGRS